MVKQRQSTRYSNMEKKSISCQKIEYIPEEIVRELLLRLPVKSLLRFKCISKSWYSLIDSEDFIKTHLQNSTINTGFSFHRICILDNFKLYTLSVASVLDDNSDDYALDIMSLPADDRMYPFTPYRLVGCCNGLFCFFSTTRRFFLWNPSTKTFKNLPDHDYIREYYVIAFGFGWEEVNDEYKLLVLLGREEDDGVAYRTLVYNSKKNSYKTLDYDMHINCYWGFDNELIMQKGVFVGGKLYWLNIAYEDEQEEEADFPSHQEIVWWDLKSEMFGVIETPFPLGEYDDFQYKLGILGGCLCCYHFRVRTEIVCYVMKEKGWERHVNVALSHVTRIGLSGPRLFKSFFNSENGDFLMSCCGSLYNDSWHVYVESLVMPK